MSIFQNPALDLKFLYIIIILRRNGAESNGADGAEGGTPFIYKKHYQ
jgi:hypothetical protein